MMSVAEAISTMGGASVQQAHPSDSSLLMRGGVGSQIALRLDGISLLGGLDHAQSLHPMRFVNLHMLERITLFRGPSSALFGEHGLAGGVSLRSRAVKFSRSKGLELHGELGGGYQSADQSPSGVGSLMLGGRRWGLLLSGGVSLAQDLKSGGDKPRVLRDSGYQTAHALAKWSWHPSEAWQLTSAIQYAHILDLHRDDLYLTEAERQTLSHRHLLGYVELKTWIRELRTRLRWQVSYQQREEEREQRHLAPGTRAVLGLRQARDVGRRVALSMLTSSEAWSFLEVRSGIEIKGEWWLAESLKSEGQTNRIPSMLWRDGWSLKGSVFLEGRAFLLRRPSARLSLEGMTRLLGERGASQPDNDLAFFEWGEGVNSSLIAVHFEVPRWLDIRLLYTSGVRLPSMVERARSGRAGLSYVLPNFELSSEGSRALELHLRSARWENLRISLRGSLQNWEELIALAPSTWQGSSSIDGRQVVRYANVAEASSVNLEAAVWWRIWMGWSARVVFTWNQLLSSNAPEVPFFWPPSPPLHLLFTTRYQFGDRGGIEFSLQMAGAQTSQHAPASILANTRKKQVSSPGWIVLSLRGDLLLLRHLRLIGSLENILAEDYTRYGSHIFAPGQNVRLLLEFVW